MTIQVSYFAPMVDHAGLAGPAIDDGDAKRGPNFRAERFLTTSASGLVIDNTYAGQIVSNASARRKDAVAHVWLKPGNGKIVVNGRDRETYLVNSLRSTGNQEPDPANRISPYDVICIVRGGGVTNQVYAIRQAIRMALARFDPHLQMLIERSVMERSNLVEREPRRIARRLYGRVSRAAIMRKSVSKSRS